MARRHSKQIILPFPEGIDRQRFGDYLSGLTDGEGCFFLSHSKRKGKRPEPLALFVIRLREDDVAILQLVRQFFQCGHLYRIVRKNPKHKPSIGLQIQKWSHLATTIIPHFDAHPLYAKKARDFKIWREAVLFAYNVSKRPLHRKFQKGFSSAWNQEARTRFIEFTRLLKDQRAYSSPLIKIPQKISGDLEPSLFDGLL